MIRAALILATTCFAGESNILLGVTVTDTSIVIEREHKRESMWRPDFRHRYREIYVARDGRVTLLRRDTAKIIPEHVTREQVVWP